MFHHIHPDMRVASHLARWGVRARSTEAKAAAVIFPTHKAMSEYVEHVYSGNGFPLDGGAGQLFASQFRTESEDGYVGVRGSTMRFSVTDDLALAHKLGVTPESRALFTAVVEELTRKSRRSDRGFADSPDFLAGRWAFLNTLDNEVVLALIMKNVPLLGESTHNSLRRLFEAGVTPEYIINLHILLSTREDVVKSGVYLIEEVIELAKAEVPAPYAARLAKLVGRRDVISLYHAGVPVAYVVACAGANFRASEILTAWSDSIPSEYVTA